MEKEEYDELSTYLEERFKGAKFGIVPNYADNSNLIFKSIEDVENKVLSKQDKITIAIGAYIRIQGEGADKNSKCKPRFKNNYIHHFFMQKKEGKRYIYYCDVIDELIKIGYERNELESLQEITCLDASDKVTSLEKFWVFWRFKTSSVL